MAKHSLVGLDIGSSSVKDCQLKESKRGFALQSFGMKPLPPEAIVDGALMYAIDLAAMGHPLQPHLWAQLKRV